MGRWIRSHWDEENVTYYFHVEPQDDGKEWVVRQIEVQQPDGTPIVASSLDEWIAALAQGLDQVAQYRSRYGALADQPLDSWDDGWPHEDISAEEFEDKWQRARRYLASRDSTR